MGNANDITEDEITNISDVEKFTFLYKNETPVYIELWDTVGQEKFNSNYIFSQSYLKGKQGVILLVDGQDFTKNIDKTHVIKDISELDCQSIIDETLEKIKMIDNSINSPILLIFNRVRNTPEELLNLNKVVLYLQRMIPNKIQNVHYLPNEAQAKFTIMRNVDAFLESAIKFSIFKEIEKENEIDNRASNSSLATSSINSTALIYKIIQEECKECTHNNINMKSGYLPTSIEMLLCCHKKKYLEENNITLNLDELKENITTFRLLDKLVEGNRSKGGSVRESRPLPLKTIELCEDGNIVLTQDPKDAKDEFE